MTDGATQELIRVEENVEPETYKVMADAERYVDLFPTMSKHIDMIS